MFGFCHIGRKLGAFEYLKGRADVISLCSFGSMEDGVWRARDFFYQLDFYYSSHSAA